MALETAQAVFQIENPYACNVALGCENRCGYCYVPKVIRKPKDVEMRLPKEPPATLVTRQLDSGKLQEKPQAVFLSFMTDPFSKRNCLNTEDLIEVLALEREISVATLSKSGLSKFPTVRHGMSIISLDRFFWREWEPNTMRPKMRIANLKAKNSPWVSLEPYPPSDIWRQHLTPLLEELKFVDLIIFGKWNYDHRATTEKAQYDYRSNVSTLRDFCKSNSIRLHIKSDTLRFVGAWR